MHRLEMVELINNEFYLSAILIFIYFIIIEFTLIVNIYLILNIETLLIDLFNLF